MNKLIMMAVIAFPALSFADQTVQTKVHCVTGDSTQVFSQTVQQVGTGSAFIDVGEYQVWPQSVNENKTLLISKNGVQGTYAHLNLGPSGSSSVFIALPQQDGSVQKCLIEMTKVKGQKRYIFQI